SAMSVTARARWSEGVIALFVIMVSTLSAQIPPKAAGVTDLGTLGGSQSNATAVNANGQGVGWSNPRSSMTQHAFLWSAPDGMVDLGTLGGAQSNATAISSSGQVVGWAHTPGDIQHAFSWTKVGGMVDLGTLGGTTSEATGLNDRGEVIGVSDVAGDATL